MNESNSVLARLERPVTKTKTRIAVLADLHLSVKKTGSWRVSHRTEERLRTTVDSLNKRRDLDGVLFVGDLVQSGTTAEYEAFDRAIEELDHPFFAIPGNHDLIANESYDSLSLGEFEARYTPGELPYHKRIAGIDFLALSSNRSTRESVADSYVGRLEPETLIWLKEKLAVLDDPLVAVHHNLSGTRSMLMDSGEHLPVSVGSPDFENADDLAMVLESADAPLVLTGHLHFPAFVETLGIQEFTVPSLGPYPNAYSVLEIDENGTTVTMQPVADYHERLESFVHGIDMCRVQIAAAQLAGLPLVDELPTKKLPPS